MTERAYCAAYNQTLHFHCAGITEAGHKKLGDRKITWRCSKYKLSGITQSTILPKSPKSESETNIVSEIRPLSINLAPLEGLREEILTLKSESADL